MSDPAGLADVDDVAAGETIGAGLAVPAGLGVPAEPGSVVAIVVDAFVEVSPQLPLRVARSRIGTTVRRDADRPTRISVRPDRGSDG
jgi:hypothetical protein